MNKKLLSIILALTLAFAAVIAAACAKTEETETNTVSATAEEFQYTLQAKGSEFNAADLSPDAPFDVTLPDNVKAYSATVVNNEVKLSKIAEGGDKLDAGTPVVVYGDGVSANSAFFNDAIVTENKTVDNLVGILNESEKTVPVNAYVLQTQTGVQAFYKVASPAPGALNRCYVIAASPNARLVISFDGEDPTAINAIEAAEAEDGTLKDGKYLIDGKVILVKNGVKYSANGQILK